MHAKLCHLRARHWIAATDAAAPHAAPALMLQAWKAA